MMNLHTKLVRLLSIGPEHWDVPMRVELRPYLEFNRRMASQLRELVARWERHTPRGKPNRFGNRRNPPR
ncbi:MAG: hypothetical protein IT426_08870 [Pirellulales bacterium]|nr:hypothetical protein [Pirellulales bacterium]